MIEKNVTYAFYLQGKELADMLYALNRTGLNGSLCNSLKEAFKDSNVLLLSDYDIYIKNIFTPKETPEQKLLRELKAQKSELESKIAKLAQGTNNAPKQSI